MSAYEFNALMLKIHTSPIAERNALIHDVITADLLLIDDLGTEPMLKNVTVEYLLLVIEERQTKGRATLVTTNLDTDGILLRYGERIYSRLRVGGSIGTNIMPVLDVDASAFSLRAGETFVRAPGSRRT